MIWFITFFYSLIENISFKDKISNNFVIFSPNSLITRMALVFFVNFSRSVSSLNDEKSENESDESLPLEARKNIYAVLNVGQSNICEVLESAKSDNILGRIYNLKKNIKRKIINNIEAHQAALLSAMIIGERASLSEDIKNSFFKSGAIHILAISGLHVGLIAYVLIMLFRAVRIPKKLSYLLVIPCLIIFAIISGAKPPVIRATIMVAVFLVGWSINREISIYNSLALAALIILIINPQQLFEIGFQLSFLSVISIVYFTKRLNKLFKPFLQ